MRDATDLLATLPAEVRADFASAEVAAILCEQLQVEPPLASLNAFLVDTPDGLMPSYVEWQTVGTYSTMARWILACAQSAWPPLAAVNPTATRGWDMPALDARLAVLYLSGIEDDPRQGVILDYKPLEQKSRREFFAIQELTGGPTAGWGILDPREVVYMTTKCYQDFRLTPAPHTSSQPCSPSSRGRHSSATSRARSNWPKVVGMNVTRRSRLLGTGCGRARSGPSAKR